MKGLEPINQRSSAGKVKRQVRRAMRKGYDFDVDMSTGEVTRGARVNPKDVKLDALGLGSTGKARRQRAKDVASAYKANKPIYRDETSSMSVENKKREGLFNTVRIEKEKGSYDPGVETTIKMYGHGPKMKNSSYINQSSEDPLAAERKRLQAQATAKAEAKADADVKANPLKNKERRDYEATATNIRLAETPEEIATWKASLGKKGTGRYNITETGRATRSRNEMQTPLSIEPAGLAKIETPGPSADVNIPKPAGPAKTPDMSISGGAIYKTKEKSKTKTPKDTAFRDVNRDGNEVTRFINKVGDSIEKGKRKRKKNKQTRNQSRGNCPPCPPCN